MAIRGKRPKPPKLHLIQGTNRPHRHGSAADIQAKVDLNTSIFGEIQRPSYLKGEARKAWDKYVVPCTWLDASHEVSAIMFCELWAEYRSSPRGFNGAKMRQLRAVQAELGMTDHRSRGAATPDQRDEFFGD